MKKAIISLSLLVSLTGICRAQNDTTKVQTGNPKWETKEYIAKKTYEVKTEYVVTIDGVTYPTNKTSVERWRLIKKFGGVPCIVKITNKSGKERITIL